MCGALSLDVGPPYVLKHLNPDFQFSSYEKSSKQKFYQSIFTLQTVEYLTILEGKKIHWLV